ncbi:hypothetical protein HGM15179_018393 [Zosterops borbonicus]|uniref:Uncharacterized protein n=1 Tax=Zosterops borbonicus TaxID=364589 RepID=A0A8K1LCB2_9PASS|nr:hypothetical protein HGM15179_018393 [Zosterops borbonicus]
MVAVPCCSPKALVLLATGPPSDTTLSLLSLGCQMKDYKLQFLESICILCRSAMECGSLLGLEFCCQRYELAKKIEQTLDAMDTMLKAVVLNSPGEVLQDTLEVPNIVSHIYHTGLLMDAQVQHSLHFLLLLMADKNPGQVVTMLLQITPQGERGLVRIVVGKEKKWMKNYVHSVLSSLILRVNDKGPKVGQYQSHKDPVLACFGLYWSHTALYWSYIDPILVKYWSPTGVILVPY